MYYISDLDNTLIYPRNAEHKCVEKINDKEITYMTEKSYALFSRLLDIEDFHFIPCTLRSYEQTKRVSIVGKSKYLICDNGASIYIDGKLDEEWDKIVDETINKKKVSCLLDVLKTHTYERDIPVRILRSNRDSFIDIIFDNKELHNKYIDLLLAYVDDSYDVVRQNKRTYIIPKGLDKSNAVSYLKNKYSFEKILCSGDSSVDKKFVELGDYSIIPNHADFFSINASVTKENGIQAGEEIVDYASFIVSTEEDPDI